MITDLGIIILLILLIPVILFSAYFVFKKQKKHLFWFGISLIVLFIIYKIFTNPYYFQKEKYINDILHTSANEVDSIKIIYYDINNSFDYSTDTLYIKDNLFLNNFFNALNTSDNINTEINFRQYKTIYNIEVTIYPEKYKNLQICIFTLHDYGTFIKIIINGKRLIITRNEKIKPIIDTMIKVLSQTPMSL